MHQQMNGWSIPTVVLERVCPQLAIGVCSNIFQPTDPTYKSVLYWNSLLHYATVEIFRNYFRVVFIAPSISEGVNNIIFDSSTKPKDSLSTDQGHVRANLDLSRSAFWILRSLVHLANPIYTLSLVIDTWLQVSVDRAHFVLKGA